MEKGNAKNSSKSNIPDTKSKQDAVNKHVRLPRYKDSLSPRPDSRKKQNPQRNRELFDKRPRNKTGAVYEKYRSEIAEGDVTEPSSKGCKKTNLNHLLNFTLATNDNWEAPGRRSTINRPKLPKYNKELFLQANCQFVARGNGDYNIHQKNPDILVEWSLIEEIRLPCHEVPSCPICLYSSVAAKITRCGHVYCWSCVLHYLSLTDKTWQKCPICFEAVHKADLKSVSLRIRKAFTVGEEITMYLMKREKGSLLSMRASHSDITFPICNVNDVDSVTRYQKLLLADKKDIETIIERERKELNEAYLQEKHTPESCFIESALKLLDEREQSLIHSLGNTTSTLSLDNINSQLCFKNIKLRGKKHLTSIGSIGSQDESCDLEENGNATNVEVPGQFSVNANSTCQNAITEERKLVTYFYQAEDGQHIYLHNINVRMLLKEFGSLELAPQKITAKIVEIEGVSMTEVLRKRLRYLLHLPLTCEFKTVELDFGNLLSESTFATFEGEVKKRKQNRNRKARDERRREKMIELEEDRKLGKYPKATYNLSSNDQFPVYNPEDFLSLSPPKSEVAETRPWRHDINPNVVACGVSNDMDNYASSSECVSTTSFAQMLRDGPKGFSQTSKVMQCEMKPALAPLKQSENSDEECTPAPEYRQSFSDAIQAALDSVTIQDPGKGHSSKKKKKGKKQLLFTTSMCRNK